MAVSKRHYRVVQRDKEAIDNTIDTVKKDFKQLMGIGIIMYFSSICLSLFLGYLIGKQKGEQINE